MALERMKVSNPLMKVRFNLKLTPQEKTRTELLKLSQDPDLMPDFMVGGPTPPGMQRKNQILHKKRELKRAKIIAKNGVIGDYAKPLMDEIAGYEYAIVQT